MERSGPNLGHLIDGEAYRDAVHVAVCPVVAAADLEPGQHVGLVGDSRELVGPGREPIGIIDPFLREPVAAGRRCWLFLYPNTVTSLRHVWTHPAFVFVPPAPRETARERA